MVHEMGNTFKNLGHLKAVSELERKWRVIPLKFIHL